MGRKIFKRVTAFVKDDEAGLWLWAKGEPNVTGLGIYSNVYQPLAMVKTNLGVCGAWAARRGDRNGRNPSTVTHAMNLCIFSDEKMAAYLREAAEIRTAAAYDASMARRKTTETVMPAAVSQLLDAICERALMAGRNI